jgi:hypothetical protein
VGIQYCWLSTPSAQDEDETSSLIVNTKTLSLSFHLPFLLFSELVIVGHRQRQRQRQTETETDRDRDNETALTWAHT